MIVRPHAFVLDATALSAYANADASMHAWATLAKRTDSLLYASALTLAEVTDGSTRDTRIRLALKAVRLQPVDAPTGFTAGRLRTATRRKPRDLTVDAVVAATALGLIQSRPEPVVVLTSDPYDLAALLKGTPVRVETIR